MGFSAKQVKALRRNLDHRYVRTRAVRNKDPEKSDLEVNRDRTNQGASPYFCLRHRSSRSDHRTLRSKRTSDDGNGVKAEEDADANYREPD
jgi:hypothetical protein